LNRNLKILLIEDDQIEVMKFKRALKKLGFNHLLIETNNGEDALNTLVSECRLPDIIILDLNMPKMNGIEFLRSLKKDEYFKFIPIIILTTSRNRNDTLECYQIGISGYFIKPLKYEEYVQLIDRLLTYWSSNELIKG